MTTTATPPLNDVDINAVGALIGACTEEPQNAETVWSASVRWKEGFASEARIRDFAPVPSDEPPALGGADGAPNPVEQLLAALGNCLAVGYAANATKAGIALEDVRIDLDGDLNLETFLGLDDEGHAGFREIRARVHIEADVAPEEIEELHRRVIGTSPVGHTLASAIPLDIALG